LENYFWNDGANLENYILKDSAKLENYFENQNIYPNSIVLLMIMSTLNNVKVDFLIWVNPFPILEN